MEQVEQILEGPSVHLVEMCIVDRDYITAVRHYLQFLNKHKVPVILLSAEDDHKLLPSLK